MLYYKRYATARRSLLAAATNFVRRAPWPMPSPAAGRGDLLDLGDLVREVGGDRLDLAVLVGPDVDAHSRLAQPKPTDVRVLSVAQVLASNGLSFEGWIDRLAEAAAVQRPARGRDRGCRDLGSAAGPDDSSVTRTHGPDPHCWQDVGRSKRYVANIADGLAAADAGRRGLLYRERAPGLRRRLDELDRWVRGHRQRADGSAQGHHRPRSVPLFSNAHGVQFLGPARPKTDSEPTAREAGGGADPPGGRTRQKIKALFVENMTNPGLVIEQIARNRAPLSALKGGLYSDASRHPTALLRPMKR